MCAISCYIGSRYNGNQLYLKDHFIGTGEILYPVLMKPLQPWNFSYIIIPYISRFIYSGLVTQHGVIRPPWINIQRGQIRSANGPMFDVKHHLLQMICCQSDVNLQISVKFQSK